MAMRSQIRKFQRGVKITGEDGIPLKISAGASAKCSMTCARAASTVIGLMGALCKVSAIASVLFDGGMTFMVVMRL
jgi:hypothetical protein